MSRSQCVDIDWSYAVAQRSGIDIDAGQSIRSTWAIVKRPHSASTLVSRHCAAVACLSFQPGFAGALTFRPAASLRTPVAGSNSVAAFTTKDWAILPGRKVG